jgi:hypothetical protein
MGRGKKTQGEQDRAAHEEDRQKINAILDEVVAAASKESQLDSFYEQKIAEIRALADCFSLVSRRFTKADPREKEILVQFLRYWQGLEHIQFLQEFINREVFWPRIGTMILDLFNKCDAMVQPGMASMLLELDALAQRLKQHATNRDAVDDPAVQRSIEEFTKRSEREKEGILIQLVEEVGEEQVPLLLAICEKDPAWALKTAALIGSLNTASSLEILKRLYEKTEQKDILKIIKKTIHALRQKGVEVSEYELQATEEAVFKKITLPDARAFVSSIDGVGDRIVFMIKPVSAHESRVFEIFMSDTSGIRDISGVSIIRKEAEQFIEKLTGEEKVMFVETTPGNACFLVEEAYRINEQAGTVVAGSIAQWRSVFSDTPGQNTLPIIYECLDAAAMENQQTLLSKAEKLFKRVEILVWFIESDEAKEGWMKIKQIKNSPLVLSQVQIEERVREQYRETAQAYFSGKTRALFKRRLEEVAYLYNRQGQDEEARLALCAAIALTSDIPPGNNPFCLSLIKESFKFFESDTVIKGSKDSLIIDPKDVSLLA